MNTLSLCMIVKNEERWLPGCLASVAGVADELVIVDTGSSDRTPAIAAEQGAVVVRFPWQNDFSLARNAGIGAATGDWILVMDADETMEPSSALRLKGLLSSCPAAALEVTVRNLLPEGQLQGYEDMRSVRLFRNRPGHRYEEPVHEQIRPSIQRNGGAIADSDIVIVHEGYRHRTVQGGGERAARNLELLLQLQAARPNDPYVYYQLGATYQALGAQPDARAAYATALRHDTGILSDAILARLFTRLAQLALSADEYLEAVGYARLSLARAPGNLIALYVAALACMYCGNVTEAYEYFTTIRRSPGILPVDAADLDAVISFCGEVLCPAS